MWDSLSEEQQNVFGSYDNYIAKINEQLDAANEMFDQVKAYEEEIGANIDNRLTAEAALGFAKNLDLAMRVGGKDAANALNSQLQDMTKNMSNEDLEKFYGQINAMDWTNMEDWDNLPDTLKQLGINVPADQLEAFISSAQDAAGALRKVDLESFAEQLKTIGSIIKDINSGEQGRNFGEDQYQALIEMDPELANKFTMNLDGTYDYIGSSMEELAKALTENTTATLNDARVQLESKVAAANVVKGLEDLGKEANNSNL
jgi:hypothetical protein